ncbi:MAG: hypothetical protein BGO97_03955 [Micrococcales bacterium 70-64]|nr:hypothetical protein [Leifsonia sp.]ODU63264.1 MAG: hypothetical protein ABT06_03960 [Leifsonia sp. SCN 70-46]OJX84955.1 MAG: hypothetical protein BGO97_03955 [Micrococcales bacterium 70-64]
MNLLKSLKDMNAMVTAAPDLIASANRLADNAKLQQAQAMAPAPVAEPSAEALTPIAGVDLTVYVRVSKGIAAYGYDAAKLPLVASAYGVSESNWALAQAGWAARIQNDAAVGAKFNQLYAGA